MAIKCNNSRPLQRGAWCRATCDFSVRFNSSNTKQTWQVRSANERTELKRIVIVTLTCCCCVWPDTHTHTAHFSGCQCLEWNYPTLFTQGALTQLSPRGGYIEGVLFYEQHHHGHTPTVRVRTHTSLNTHARNLTQRHTTTCTRGGVITGMLITELYSCGAQQT